MKPDFFVFGATGMQGKIVLRDLVEHNYQIFISSHKEEELKKLKQLYPMVSGRTLDLRDREATLKLIAEVQPRVIINCAGRHCQGSGRTFFTHQNFTEKKPSSSRIYGKRKFVGNH